MLELIWQKSSYSTGDGDTKCIELAAAPAGTLHIRESDEPDHVLSPSRVDLAALLGQLKQDGSPLR